jgi:pimeloyl-ACP methyl ester carboxylesterase
MQRPRYKIEKAYPELFRGADPLLTLDDIEQQRTFLANKSVEQTARLREQLATYTLKDGDETEYKMAVLRGTSKNVFVGFSEYATHTRRDRLAQLLSIRALCDPKASIVFQAHSAWGQNAMNLSGGEDGERKKVRAGSALPFVERTVEALKSHHLFHRTNIHAVGASLGATLATEFATQARTRSLTLLETPDIVSRSYPRLIKDFLASGPNLYPNIDIGMLGTNTPTLHQGFGALALFSANALHPDNLATAGLLRHDTHEENILAALDKNPHMGIVRAWTARSAISPREENLAIEDVLKTYKGGEYADQVESYEFGGELASHNSSNIPVLLGALTRRAMALSRPPRHQL